MGTYATTSSFTNLLPYLLKGNSTSDSTGVAILSAQITRAESIVNSYVSARYSLPFSVVPPIIRTLSEDLTSCFTIRGSYVQDGQRENKYDEAFCKQAYAILEGIKKGEIPLTLTDGSLVSTKTTTRILSSTENFAPTFNLDDPDNWEVDSDRLDEIEGGRK